MSNETDRGTQRMSTTNEKQNNTSESRQRLCVGMRVRILPLVNGKPCEGVIYWQMQETRRWPWYVRPDGTPDDQLGMAFAGDELEPIACEEGGIQ